MNWKRKLMSRKLWLAIVAALIPILNEHFGWQIPTDALLAVLAPILAYILGEAYVDGQRAATSIVTLPTSDCPPSE